MGIKETVRSWWTNESPAERDERHLRIYGRGPSPWDKYLPVWVIVTMSLAVVVLLLMMKVATSDACHWRPGCAPWSMAGEQSAKDRADAAAAAAASAASAATPAASR